MKNLKIARFSGPDPDPETDWPSTIPLAGLTPAKVRQAYRDVAIACLAAKVPSVFTAEIIGLVFDLDASVVRKILKKTDALKGVKRAS